MLKITPKNYNLVFEPDLKNLKFFGKETIDFKMSRPSGASEMSRPSGASGMKKKTKEIILDSKELKIKDCQLLRKSGPKKLNFLISKKQEKLKISLPENLKPGFFQIITNFEGKLNSQLNGFYASKYQIAGKEKTLATTQFEPTDAHRAFPCFDNPDQKATFEISLIVVKNLTTISNTLPLEEKNLPGGKKLVKFAKTPPMSTYLLYLGIGEFEFLEKQAGKLLLRIATTPGKSRYGKFALEVTEKCLRYFENYFDIPYPLPKLDLIAIPDFEAGAMENWGAITFRENLLLVYKGKTTKANLQRIAEVIAHEISHMWFGNLVTMKQWDDLWLNESFATFMAYKALNHYWPEWNIWADYLTDTVFSGMALDGLQSSRAIKIKVKKQAEINELFDEIAYDKGGGILRMTENCLGEKDFRKGLAAYLKKFEYKNAKAQDLWRVLGKTSKKPIVKMMKRFVLQPGFPLITADISGILPVIGKNKRTFTQKRFLFLEDKNNEASAPQSGAVSLRRPTKRLLSVPFILAAERRGILGLGNKQKWILPLVKGNYLNRNYAGFFVTDYDEKHLEKLGQNLGLLNNLERLGLIHDLFLLVFADKKDLWNVLDYLEKYLFSERDPAVANYILGKLWGIYLMMRNKRVGELLLKFSHAFISQTGPEPKKEEIPQRAILRASALHCLYSLDDPKTQGFLKKKFTAFRKEESSLAADLRGVVFNFVVFSKDENYLKIFKLYQKADAGAQEEKIRLLRALGNSRNQKLIGKTLGYLLSPSVRLAHFPYLLASLANNPEAKNPTLIWLFKNWRKLVKITGGGGNPILRKTLKTVIPVCAIGKEKEAKEFFRIKINKAEGLERSLGHALEELEINSRFVKRYKEDA